MAEREGFEPSKGVLNPYSLSRGAPSAAQPPLRLVCLSHVGRSGLLVASGSSPFGPLPLRASVPCAGFAGSGSNPRRAVQPLTPLARERVASGYALRPADQCRFAAPSSRAFGARVSRSATSPKLYLSRVGRSGLLVASGSSPFGPLPLDHAPAQAKSPVRHLPKRGAILPVGGRQVKTAAGGQLVSSDGSAGAGASCSLLMRS